MLQWTIRDQTARVAVGTQTERERVAVLISKQLLNIQSVPAERRAEPGGCACSARRAGSGGALDNKREGALVLNTYVP